MTYQAKLKKSQGIATHKSYPVKALPFSTRIACNTRGWILELTTDWKRVTCKRCLKLKPINARP
jgi:RNase P subunit RPR2